MKPDIKPVSLIKPLSPAIERAKQMLFQPFDLGRWFTIGFCAWLSALGQTGSNLSFPDILRYRQGNSDPHRLSDIREFIMAHLSWLIIAAVVVVLFLIAMKVLLLWLNSRGRFMFLDCVAQNKAYVKFPWAKFRSHANSLFFFRLAIMVIFTVSVCILSALILLVILVITKTNTPFVAPGIALIFLLSVLAAFIIVAFSLINVFTCDFVVPIMYISNVTCTGAWEQFWPLLRQNKNKFMTYLLFQLLIALCLGAIASAVCCVFFCLTCGIVACLAVIPVFGFAAAYILHVLLLPLSVFRRSYSLYYLQQYNPKLSVFAEASQCS
ncbi:MAG: hypothetical protein ABIG61_12350 [Planctomycetota bacterium]